jgi:glycosyltransferase involved in cell wall biosynthesis
MQYNLTTVVPVYNGEKFIGQTLQSIARQKSPPDRLIVLDNCSTDGTEKVVRDFKEMPCEYIRNDSNIGLFGNCNKALGYAASTRYLHLCCADDLVTPDFYSTLMGALDDCQGFGLAYCLDERIDEDGRHLSLSGKVTGANDSIPPDIFVSRKAEIANQAFSGSLMKLNFKPSPSQFRLDMPILADVAFWGDFGQHCDRVVQVNQPLCQYRWHGDNTTNTVMPGMQALILDEWKVMQLNEGLRKHPAGFVRRFKLKGLFGVRTGIKAKRIRQQGNLQYSREITREGKRISGLLAWYMAQMVVEARDLLIYGILRRRRHPKNVYG